MSSCETNQGPETQTDDLSSAPLLVEASDADQAPLVMVVDDLESNAMMLQGMLEAGGYRTRIVTDGLRAIEAAQEQTPDLVILDLVMPGISGIETCRRLKREPWGQGIPVIFVTGDTRRENLLDAFAAGGVDYLTKPIYSQELLARIGVQLRLRRAERDLEQRNHELRRTTIELSRTNARLQELYRIDALTGLLNRRAWDEEAQRNHAISARYNRVYGILMIDIDLFKKYNDTYGHQAGDDCLTRVAAAIAGGLRDIDVIGRYGGEEFVVLMPETRGHDALHVAERIRERIWRLAIPHQSSPALRVTVSIGAADCMERDLATTISSADQALYMAKSQGRNAVFGSRSSGLASVADTPSSSGVMPSRRDDPTPHPYEHILLVTEDAEARSLIESQCQDSMFEIHHVADAGSFREDVTSHDWSTVILDLRHARESMLECLEHVRGEPDLRIVPVIGICHSRLEDIRINLDEGFDEIIDLPMSEYQIKSKLTAMCQHHSERKALEYSCRLRGEQVLVLAYTVEYAQRATQARKLDEVCEILLQGAAEIMCAQSTSLQLLETCSDSPQVMIWDPSQDPPYINGDDASLSEDVLHEILSSDVLIASSSDPEPGDASANDPTTPAFTSSFHTLLKVGKQNLGILSAHRHIRHQLFTEHEAELYKVFGCLASSRISEILYQEARDEAVGIFVKSLAMMAENRDHATAAHANRVSHISRIIARQLQEMNHDETISEQFISDLSLAAPLHDIGKMSVPDSILMKSAKLTVHEMSIMRMHCELGVDILKRLVDTSENLRFARTAMDVVRHHHEHYDGNGYPDGLSGQRIPLASRIVSVADAYDAMTNDRVYRKALSHEEALSIIKRNRGTQFDPAVVDAFLREEETIKGLSHESTHLR